MKVDIKKIKELLNSDVTGYRIGQVTTVRQQNYDRYKKGLATLEDMPLKTAIELQKYINMEENKMKLLSKEDFRSVDAEYQEQVMELVEFLENNTVDEGALLEKLNELGFETEELSPEYRGGVEIIGLTSLENVFREADGEYEVLYANFKDGKCVGIYWGA